MVFAHGVLEAALGEGLGEPLPPAELEHDVAGLVPVAPGQHHVIEVQFERVVEDHLLVGFAPLRDDPSGREGVLPLRAGIGLALREPLVERDDCVADLREPEDPRWARLPIIFNPIDGDALNPGLAPGLRLNRPREVSNAVRRAWRSPNVASGVEV